jgi:hypothetical protein
MSGFGREGRDGNIPLDSSVARPVLKERCIAVMRTSTLTRELRRRRKKYLVI